MNLKINLLCLILFFLSGCESSNAPSGEAAKKITSSPDTKEVLRYLMRNLDVPLTVDSSCNAVGTSADDKTIGDYLSGFLAEFTNRTGQNWLDVTVTANTLDGKAVWENRVMVRRSDAEDEMGWGVSFYVIAENGVVVRESFRCLGGG